MRHLLLATVAALALSATARADDAPTVAPQPNPDAAVQPVLQSAAAPDLAATVDALRSKVRYVFVLFQENRSFDSYFGSFPGARGLFSQPPAETPGYTQQIVNTDGTLGSIQPFRIGPAQFAADTDDIDHGHARMAAKMHLVDGRALMDQFALVEEQKYTPAGATAPPLKAKQYGELAMAYEDCDTVPFLWRYADRFALFDNIFQTTIGPSTPNALAMIAGQTGETQWVKHPEQASNLPANFASGGEPVVSDPDPFWGSPADHQSGQPVRAKDYPGYHTAPNQTYASLPLTLPGRDIATLTQADRDPAHNLADVQQDIAHITQLGHDPYPWGWYEEGYDREPTDGPDAPAGGSHTSYIAHHNGPQYFGYVADNPKMSANLHGLGDFFTDMAAHRLPDRGLFFVRGGYTDIAGLTPADKDPAVQKNFLGDDDHPAYSDSELSEALVAREVNAIARSPYWDQSAIIITYDESEGDYDHVPPQIIDYDPAGLPLRRGPRIPLLLISPYARAHVVSHESGDHNSVIKLVNELFGLPPLADLPDELQARTEGVMKFHQDNLGPEDDHTPGVGDLLSGFDQNRLTGKAPPLSSDYATIPDDVISHIPHYDGQGCHAIGMVPEDAAKGIHNPIPADFNPRPSTNPSTPR